MKNYISRIDKKRFIIMIIGNLLIGIGVSIFKISGMGTDPCSSMVMSLAEKFNISFATFLIFVNAILFIIEAFLGRHFIGAGTFVNAVLLGYVITFFHGIWLKLFGVPGLFWQRIIIMLVGVIVCSLGVSLYQSSDMGVAPYDSLSLIMKERISKLSYFWHRIVTDAIAVLIGIAAGGITGGLIGLGTLVSVFGLGPIIQFFNVNVTKKILGENK